MLPEILNTLVRQSVPFLLVNSIEPHAVRLYDSFLSRALCLILFTRGHVNAHNITRRTKQPDAGGVPTMGWSQQVSRIGVV